MSDPIFNNLMIHRCDLDYATVTAADEATYGHAVPSFASVDKKATQIPCRLMVLSVQETMRMGLAPTMVGQYALYLPYAALPPGLSMVEGSATFQVSNINKRNGSVYDPGPFTITSVIDASGENHHIKVLLTRISDAIFIPGVPPEEVEEEVEEP